jgi:hypothetical protein
MNRNKEIAILVAALAVGALLGPMIVFLVGQAVFGPYAGGAGMGTFYGQFWRELANADPIPWMMLISPYLLLQWLRLLQLPLSGKAHTPPQEPDITQ